MSERCTCDDGPEVGMCGICGAWAGGREPLDLDAIRARTRRSSRWLREDVLALLAEVERLAGEERYLRGTLAGYEGALERAHRREDKRTAERDAARAEVAAMREGMSTLIGDLDTARADGVAWTYGGVQRRLRTLLARPASTDPKEA